MKSLIVLLLVIVNLHSSDISGYKYYKNIIDIDKNFTKIKLDKEIYLHSDKDFRDIRIYEGEKEQGFIIQREKLDVVKKFMLLYPNSYVRDSATITFVLNKPSDIKEINLSIDDRDFETIFDLYINDKLFSSSNQIYDYSKETGNQNFTIKVDAKDVKKITLSYNLSKTRFFYKKYKKIEKLTQYLTLKSINLKIDNKAKLTYDFSYINPLNISTKDKISTYIFDTKNLPIDMLEIFSQTKYFQRKCEFYVSENSKSWNKIGKYNIFKSAFDGKRERLYPQIRAKYLRIDIQNRDNQPIEITALKIGTIPSYLYFLPEFDKKYRLYFGNKDAQLPSYDLKYQLPKTKASKSLLSKLEINNKYKLIQKPKLPIWEEHKELLFIILALISIVLLIFIAAKLLQDKEN